MKDSTRQKYLDAMNRRADLMRQADEAFDAGNVESGIDFTNQAKELNGEIAGYQALMEEEARFAGKGPAAPSAEARERAEERAETLRAGGRIEFTQAEVLDAFGVKVRNATTLATGTLVEPTRVDTTIRDGLATVSSIIDQVTVQDLTGCQAIFEPILTAEMDAQSGKVSTLAGTTHTPSDPAFSAAKIAPYEVNVTTYVDRNLSRLTPVAYEEKIRSLAMRALRRKVASLIYNGDGQASPDLYGIKTAKDVAGNALFKTVNVSAIAVGFLDDLVYAYGSDEEVGGNARLFLSKKDLQAIGKLRNSDGDKYYQIVPDPANANIGRIIDGGLIVPYTIGSALTALSQSTAGSTAVQTMVYGDPTNYLLGLFGPYSIRIDESVKAVERMNTILGDVFVGGNLVVTDGFVVATLPKSGS